MTRPRALLPLLALVLPACVATPERPAVDPAAARRAALCADEHPLDAAARAGCESDRGRLAQADRRPLVAAKRPTNDALTDGPAPVVVVVGSGSGNAGQGLIDYGRQMAAPPVRCTAVRMGALVSARCR